MIALGIEYDGRAFCGWQRQAQGERTIQAAVETAISAIAGMPQFATAAGRTDTGVHAALQVVHFAPAVLRPLTAWVRGVNAHLPADVSVRWGVEVAADFHARFSAVSRQYIYWLGDRPTRSALAHGRVGWTHLPLNAPLMHEASQSLVGTHDFSSFRASACQAKSPVKTVQSIRIVRVGERIRMDIQANAFLHHMVRNIVGALVYVGAEKIPAAQISTLLAEKNRAHAPPTFAPDGLYLAGIQYPAHFAIPEAFVDVVM